MPNLESKTKQVLLTCNAFFAQNTLKLECETYLATRTTSSAKMKYDLLGENVSLKVPFSEYVLYAAVVMNVDP